MQLGFEGETRKPIKSTVKTRVYKRAGGCCESCGMPLDKTHGDFHHWRSPTISPTAKTVQFLCPTCHRKYGHTRKVVTHQTLIGEEKEIVTIRYKVKRKRKATKKKSTPKKKTTKKTTKKKVTKKPKRKVKKTTKKKKTPKRTKTKKKTTKKKTTRKSTKKKTTRKKKK